MLRPTSKELDKEAKVMTDCCPSYLYNVNQKLLLITLFGHMYTCRNVT